MKAARTLQGKIISHSSGMGVPSPDLVRQRAGELAKISGHAEATEDDWKHAKEELHGGHDNGIDSDDVQFVSERDMVAGSTGHHVGRTGFDESESLGEELVAEGMDEAVHERMLEAADTDELDRIDGF